MDARATITRCSPSYPLVHALPASFLGIPLELREAIYDLVAAPSETILKVSRQKTTITFGYEPVLLLCKQIFNEFLRVARPTETLRCDMKEEDWPSWRLQKVDRTLGIVLGALSDSILVLKTSVKPDESCLWYIVDRLPMLQELHVRLPDEDFDFSLEEKYLSTSAQQHLERLTVSYFQPPFSRASFIATLMIWTARPTAGEGRRMLDQNAQSILNRVVGRGLNVFSHVDLYTLPVSCKGIVIRNNQKLRQRWRAVLDGTSGKLISKTLGKLCWRDMSYLEQWTQELAGSQSLYQSVPNQPFSLIQTPVTTVCDTSTELPLPQDSVLERYANLVSRKKPHENGSKRASNHVMGRLTYSKDQNTQARML